MSADKKRMLFVCFELALMCVALDQFTKYQAVTHLKGQPSVPLITGVLELAYVENFGAAFGILQNARLLFTVISSLAVIVLLYILYKMPYQKKYVPLFFMLSLILSGAVGNLIDRIRTGYVVDFIYFSLIDFPVFNIADICVTCGAFTLVLLAVFRYRDEDFRFLNAASEKARREETRKEEQKDTGGEEKDA